MNFLFFLSPQNGPTINSWTDFLFLPFKSLKTFVSLEYASVKTQYSMDVFFETWLASAAFVFFNPQLLRVLFVDLLPVSENRSWGRSPKNNERRVIYFEYKLKSKTQSYRLLYSKCLWIGRHIDEDLKLKYLTWNNLQMAVLLYLSFHGDQLGYLHEIRMFCSCWSICHIRHKYF